MSSRSLPSAITGGTSSRSIGFVGTGQRQGIEFLIKPTHINSSLPTNIEIRECESTGESAAIIGLDQCRWMNIQEGWSTRRDFIPLRGDKAKTSNSN